MAVERMPIKVHRSGAKWGKLITLDTIQPHFCFTRGHQMKLATTFESCTYICATNFAFESLALNLLPCSQPLHQTFQQFDWSFVELGEVSELWLGFFGVSPSGHPAMHPHSKSFPAFCCSASLSCLASRSSMR